MSISWLSQAAYRKAKEDDYGANSSIRKNDSKRIS